MAFQARALTPTVSLEFDGLSLVATIHPSAVLRTLDDRRDEIFAGLVADLEFAGRTAAMS